jgi:hypothetical protein
MPILIQIWILQNYGNSDRIQINNKDFSTPLDQITIKTPNPTGLFLKIDVSRDLAAGVYLSEAPSPLRFLFEAVKQFGRFGIWSNTVHIV